MIFHITSLAEWKQAQKKGQYTAPSLETEGFIHCSTREQILKVANSFYRGQTNLIILGVDPEKLDVPLKWEDPVHPNPDDAPEIQSQEKFPHIYGVIPVEAIANVVNFPMSEDGTFQLPSDIQKE